MKKLLLLSNSTLSGQPFFQWPEPYVKEFLGEEPRSLLFFPFAGVTMGFDDYTMRVSSRFKEMGYTITGAHNVKDKKAALQTCGGIVVGGGNTFQLIKYLQDGWSELIKAQVQLGTPYIGWSAGANVACPTIKTTNDMPIVEPASFDALNLVDFQINPHYTEAAIPNHGGETRPDRIREFIAVNPEATVLGLPEGSLIEVTGEEVIFKGTGKLVVFRQGYPTESYASGSQVSSVE